MIDDPWKITCLYVNPVRYFVIVMSCIHEFFIIVNHYIYIGYMMLSYSKCMIYAGPSHACTVCTCIPILIYKYLTQWIMVYVFVGKYVNQIMNVTLLDMCDTSQLTYSLMIGENYNE